MTVDINNESGLEVDSPGLVRLATFALDQLRIHPQAELSILLVDEETMSSYHEKYMGEDGPTDVLSFPIDGSEAAAGPRELGDVVICPAEAEDLEEAVVHGVLHLCGYDHESDDGEMLALQERVLGELRA
jgi:probable rRNA maturation factor